MSSTTRETGADAELTTLVFEVAARRAPLRHLLSRIRRSQHGTTSSILSVPGVDGMIPLHRACQFGSIAMVKCFLELGVKHRVAGGSSGGGGLFVGCRSESGSERVVTPMDLAVDRIRFSNDGRRKRKLRTIGNYREGAGAANAYDDEEDWEVLALCLRYAYAARYRQPMEMVVNDAPSVSTRISAAIGIMPVDVLDLMIRRYDPHDCTTAIDQFGRSIMTKTIHIATEAQLNYEWETCDNYSGILKTLVDMENMCKEAAERDRREDGISSPQGSNRHPLYVAAEYGLDWSNGMNVILQSNYDLLLVQDTITRLYPFMLAACGVEPEIIRHRGLRVLKRLLDRSYKVCGSANPWTDFYSCFHSNTNDGGGGNSSNYDDYTTSIEKKKDEFWRDIIDGSKVAEEKDRVTIQNSNSISFRNHNSKTFLSKDDAFSLVHDMAGPLCNLNSTFELLRCNPAIMNRFVRKVRITNKDNVSPSKGRERRISLVQKEKKRNKQRNRRRRLRQKNRNKL